MPTARPALRRRLLWTGAVVLGLGLLLFLLRLPLTGYGVGLALRLAGAGDTRYRVTASSPWRMVVEELGFRMKAQELAAQRVTITRAHWWSLALQEVKVEGAVLPVAIDGSDVNPFAWATYRGQGKGVRTVTLLQLPVDHLRVEGRLQVNAAALAPRDVAVLLTADRGPGAGWIVALQAHAAGLELMGDGRYDPLGDRLDFRLTKAELELSPWQDHLQRWMLLPGGPWTLEGRLSATLDGHYAANRSGVAGLVRWRAGRLASTAHPVSIEGISADFEFTDLLRLQSRPGSFRARELRSGDVALSDLDLTLSLEGPDRLSVSRATLGAFGGRLVAEPFRLYPAQQELEAVVVADGLDVEQILAASHDVPAQATGRVNGRLPLRLDNAGLRFGTGWLELKPGVRAEIQFNATGLLTSGLGTGGPGYAIMKKIENGLLRLKLTELRLDIRPPNGPPGRTATLHVVGEPVDPGVKAPVTLDVNINGSLEQLLNLGLDSRVHFTPRR
jgi:hypothetical protein